jgi:hypothetical protein
MFTKASIHLYLIRNQLFFKKKTFQTTFAFYRTT